MLLFKLPELTFFYKFLTSETWEIFSNGGISLYKERENPFIPKGNVNELGLVLSRSRSCLKS